MNLVTLSGITHQYSERVLLDGVDLLINEGERVANSTMTAIAGRMSAYTGREISWQWATKGSKLDLSPAKYEFGPAPENPVAVPGVTKLI